MRKLFALLIVIAFSTNSFAQRGYKKPYWNANIMLSSATFLSDLGGKDFYGSNDPSDIDYSDIRYAIGGGLDWNNGKGFSMGVNAFYSRLSANDSETDWDRKYRMLHVRTDLIETNFKLQYTFPKTMSGLAGVYFNVGGGVTFFKPMAEWNGIWYDLRPMGTEGQNIDPTREPYKKFSPVIPFGFGKRFALRNGMNIAIDVSLRKSFTDYLDDVSTVYADTNLILANAGVAAAHFSNPSNNEDGVGRIGKERGNPNNFDNYFLFGLKLEIPLGQAGKYGNYNTSCAFQNSWISNKGTTPKFKKRGRTRKRIFR